MNMPGKSLETDSRFLLLAAVNGFIVAGTAVPVVTLYARCSML